MKKQKNFETRLTKLEDIVRQHLQDSGTVLTNIEWLKKSFWTLTGAVLTFNVMLAVTIVKYLIEK